MLRKLLLNCWVKCLIILLNNNKLRISILNWLHFCVVLAADGADFGFSWVELVVWASGLSFDTADVGFCWLRPHIPLFIMNWLVFFYFIRSKRCSNRPTHARQDFQRFRVWIHGFWIPACLRAILWNSLVPGSWPRLATFSACTLFFNCHVIVHINKFRHCIILSMLFY